MRIWLTALGVSGALCGAGGVALAAAGAHLTGDPVVTTAAYFLLLHAGAILALCAMVNARPDTLTLVATSLLLVGVVMFSGDLAVRGLAHVVMVHMLAPAGGIVLIVGWLAAAVAMGRVLGRRPTSC